MTLFDSIRQLALCLVGLSLTVAPLVATAAEDDSAAKSVARQSMPVKIANRTIVILRGPIAGYSAIERASGAMRRIEQGLESQTDAQASVVDLEESKATQVLVGSQPAFLITLIDIDTQAGETTQIVAREAAKRLDRAIVEWREQRTPRYLATASGFAAAATLAFAALLWLVIRGNVWIGGRLSAAAASHSEKLRVGGVRLLDAARVPLYTRRLLTLIAWVISIVLATAWLTFVLVQFPYTRPWGEGLEGNLLELLSTVAVGILEATPGLLLVVIIFMIARTVVRVLAAFFDRVANGQIDVKWLDRDTVWPTRRITNVVVYLFALTMAYPYLPGSGTEAFKGLSVLIGVMVSLGGASVIGQAFSGLILMYIKAFRRGDYVRIGDIEGTVMDLGMFATRIRTGMGEEIVLPNSGIMSTTTKNYSRAVPGAGFIVDTVVTIGYSTPWRQVEAMLLEAARRTPDIATSPSPMVRQTALSDYYVEYRLIAYTPVERPVLRADVLNQLHGYVQDVFNEYSVQIMSPHYMMDPSAPQVVPKKDWYLRPAKPPDTGNA